MVSERKRVDTEKEKKSDPSGPPEQIAVALPTELQRQMGVGRGKLRW